MNEIPSRYNPKETEDKWYKFWEENNFFCAKPNPSKKPFCIVIPPPNITGILHMGHALNNAIQDILIRYHRMLGEESLWMPGTDHAGIATQNVVEKSISKDGLKRQDLGRDKFIERVRDWKEKYGSTIIHQLKKLGASCDWARTRFTMDSEYSQAVKKVFVALWDKGLIYQGNKVINWCPRCQTALSDEEAPHQEINGALYYIKYPLKEPTVHTPQPTKKTIGYRLSRACRQAGTIDYITVATTRPETMLGDSAVAVNPRDKRYKKLIGKILILPLLNREIKIIADSMVDMKFGTGAVKVTPSHDPNDYTLGKKHNLEFINIMCPDGTLNENAGGYNGMDRFEAREVILEDLKEKGLLEKVESHSLSAGHCYRCHTIIEPYLSRQWFVKMKPLAEPAIEAVKSGKIKFYPKRWEKVYLNWMENIQDWCISRQIWWGHRIPIWYCLDCKQEAVASMEIPSVCRKCNSTNLSQDEDVLDTWFSSWLWPFATFYWPNIKGQSPSGTVPSDDLKYFYPTSVLVTAPEIIFFWVARMIMAGLEFMKDIPFKDIYIHGTVRDIEGKKMSKSLGNIIDPLEIINEYGSDALRFSLISITSQGQDVYLSKERFEQGRNFANKIWNASRFILMNLESSNIKVDLCAFHKKETLSLVNRWVLSRFYSVLKQVNGYLDNYRFNEAANTLYSFFWHEFCDWYLELIKADIKSKENQVVMYKILEKFLRLLHPFMPFITEELWQRIPHEGVSIMRQLKPRLQEGIIDKKTEKLMESVFELINIIRNMRSELDIPAKEAIDAKVFLSSKAKRQLLESMSGHIRSLSHLNKLFIGAEYSRSAEEFAAVFKDMHIVIPLSGSGGVQEHKLKIGRKIENAHSEIRSKEKVLSNADFLKKAPKEIVAQERVKLNELKKSLKKLEAVKNGIG